ncbi:MAG: 2-dehydropantoate 2-reductase [Proteobacteria bacterium]|nr:2-dehydropantoate 2-reductase [Pseudomonadota bacterium]
MRFLVIGAGAMGCLFAARLARAGFEVTLLEKIDPWVEKINDQGIMVEGVSGAYQVKVPAFSGTPPLQPDLVLICVKSYDTEEAAKTLKSWLNREAVVLTLQNGVGNLEILQDVFGKERVLGGVTANGATVLGPGRIRHAGEGDTLIGPAGGDAEKVVSSFRRAGFKTEAVDRVQDLLWGKLIVNVGINALAAITRVKNGRLPHIEGTRILMAQAVEEAVAVAKAKDIRLPYPDPLAKVLEVCQATAGNVASMLQDILNEKMTEISFINGAIVREGEAFGIATPVNRTLTTLVNAIQASYGDRV